MIKNNYHDRSIAILNKLKIEKFVSTKIKDILNIGCKVNRCDEIV